MLNWLFKIVFLLMGFVFLVFVFFSCPKVQEQVTRAKEYYAEKVALSRQKTVEYFNANSAQILSDARTALTANDYQRTILLTSKYLISGNGELVAIHNEAKSKLAEIQKAKKTEKLLAEIKTVPDSDYEKNKSLYQQLAALNPDNADYQSKVTTYEQKIAEDQEKKRIAEERYEIVESEDQSHKAMTKSLSSYTYQELVKLPIDKKMGYRVVVSPTIKENQVRPTVEKIIADITSKDNDIDEISLLLYSDKELANEMYDVARATWAPNGKLGNVTPEIAKTNNRNNYKLEIQIAENLEQYLKQRAKSEQKLGFTEDRRRKIFKEILAAEDKAWTEARKRYPLVPTDHLSVGQTISLSRRTPLMPELDPTDPMAAYLRIRKLDPRTTIKVLKVSTKHSNPWYFVEARSPSRYSLGTGWINSIALRRQGQVDFKQQVEKQHKLKNRLIDKHNNELAKKYGLTREQLEQICLEGMMERWPFEWPLE